MVDFLVIGAAKAGSTTICDILSKSSEINFSKVKEPGTLYKNDNYDQIIDEYERLFDSKCGLKGEGTTGYAEPRYLDVTLKNLEYLEKTPKFILVVRNPMKRIESGLMQRKKKGEKNFNPEELLNKSLGLYTRSMYGLVVSRYTETFGSKSLLILKFDDILDNKQIIVNSVKEFLCIQDLSIEYFEHKNKSLGAKQLPWISRFYMKYLREHYNYIGLPKLTKIAGHLVNIFGKEIASKYHLNEKQKQVIKDILKFDAIEFEKLVGFNYFDLKH